ncbi:DNA repair protein RecO [Candidatus Falkowbacteria bacterium CG10_big_fil_rev_8_21_14_0_10_43_10]|uniref:DNA repair protein RecO n=1 Tax=Candidatus Falkowbacteria bacterium CG10_big_fil_rev_8_21_14_0_10_43_10 TaxID=1974567 RepID=A0A2H0V580_9BACT|nr:MAG: DNA repair protein RecO [Candidatus Falkowbacteria bacterium CG10_big_fil_rev_8_21_14_0_10_43_10]
MEVTQKTKAIILRREFFNESDSRVFVYTQDFGKLDLIARGTQKLSSKLAAHIEPLNLAEIMIIKGRQYDYLGSCVSEEIFSGIKDNYEKSITAGEAVRAVDEIVKGEEKDERIFLMLKKFLETLNIAGSEAALFRLQILKNAFVLKLISILGYQPKLDGFKIGELKPAQDVISAMRIVLENKFSNLINFEFDEILTKNLEDVILKYKMYIFD